MTIVFVISNNWFTSSFEEISSIFLSLVSLPSWHPLMIYCLELRLARYLWGFCENKTSRKTNLVRRDFSQTRVSHRLGGKVWQNSRQTESRMAHGESLAISCETTQRETNNVLDWAQIFVIIWYVVDLIWDMSMCDSETKHISGWGCILMTTSHSRRSLKHILYKCRRPDMSMKFVSCPYHNLHHTTRETPRDSPSTATVTVRPSIYQAGIASLWPLATVAGAETLLYI